jgi:hypothetical protein
MGSPAVSRKPAVARSTTKSQTRAAKTAVKPAKARVLIEFPTEALLRADDAARATGVSRSEFIRAAVEQRLEAMAEEEFERELEESYKANAELNLQILKEFEHVDRETWEKLP